MPKPKVYPPEIRAIYDLYPRKRAPQVAMQAIERSIERLTQTMPMDKEQAIEFLRGKTGDYAKTVSSWPKSEYKFIPHPSTWFNQERYLDDPREWANGKGVASDDLARGAW